MRFNGITWSVMKTFPGGISSGLAISKTSVWVFGGFGRAAWHYNGSNWTRSVSGRGLDGASALSPSSIWAYSTKGAAHWNGKSWKRGHHSSSLCRKRRWAARSWQACTLAPARSVYVLGSEGGETVGGPLVLLHYNGTSWHRVATAKEAGAPDGHRR